MIRINHKNVVYRKYDDFGVIYNLETKSIITLQEVALDIFDFAFMSNRELKIEDISKHISELYEVEYDLVFEDVVEFINSLICERYIIDDNTKIDTDVVNTVPKNEYRDLEGEIIAILQKRNQLFSATIELTYLCNEKCIHCYATYCDKTQPKRELDVDKCKRIIDELKEMKCCHINFTGGDPFVFKGFDEVFKYAREQNFVCCIYTNGQAMYFDKKIADKIIEYVPRTIYISLYGATAEVHDSITQVKGSFERTIAIAKKLIENKVSVVFQMMILTINYRHVNDMIALAETLGADYRVGLSIINKNNGDSSPQQYAVSDIETVKEIISISKTKFISMDKESAVQKTDLKSSICGAGTSSVCISPDGNVYPCVSLKIKIGNIFSKSLKAIWNSKERKDVLDSLIWEKAEKCPDCKYVDYCPHCVGISHLENGRMLSCNNCDFLLAKASYEINN